jgi:hypothetical protein
MQAAGVRAPEAASALRDSFKLIADEQGQLSYRAFLQFDEIKTLLEDGLLAQSEVEQIWVEVAGSQSAKLDVQGFLTAYTKVDDLFEEDEMPNGTSSSNSAAAAPPTLNGTAKSSSSSAAKAPPTAAAPAEPAAASEEEEAALQRIFEALTGGPGKLASLAQIMQWDELSQLVSDGEITMAEVARLYSAAPKASGDSLDFAGFVQFNEAVDALFEYEDDDNSSSSASSTSSSAGAVSTAAGGGPTAVVSAAVAASGLSAEQLLTPAKPPTAAQSAVAESVKPAETLLTELEAGALLLEEEGERGAADDSDDVSFTEADVAELQSEFDALLQSSGAASSGTLTLQQLQQWGEVQELLSEGELDAAEVLQLWQTVPKCAGTAGTAAESIDFSGFLEFNAALDSLFESDSADDTDEDDEEMREVEEQLIAVLADAAAGRARKEAAAAEADALLNTAEAAAAAEAAAVAAAAVPVSGRAAAAAVAKEPKATPAELKAQLLQLVLAESEDCGIYAESSARAKILRVANTFVARSAGTGVNVGEYCFTAVCMQCASVVCSSCVQQL